MEKEIKDRKDRKDKTRKAIFTAETLYDDKAILAFCTTQFYSFEKKTQIILLVLSLGLILLGASGIGGLVAAAICIPIGCWILMGISSIPQNHADKVTEAMNGAYHKTVFSFHEDVFSLTVGKDSNEIEYVSLIRLLEDDDYYYLFALPKLAYLVSKKSLRPAGESERFRKLIASANNLEWKSTKPWWKKNFKSLFTGFIGKGLKFF